VLRLAPVEELELDTDPGRRGWRLHAALATLHRRCNMLREVPTTPASLDADQYQGVVEEVLAELLQLAQDDRTLQRALGEIDQRLLTAWLEEYQAQHALYDSQWAEFDEPLRPAYFEVSFGTSLTASASQPHAPDRLSREEPLVLQAGDELVKLSGRIDRIDVGRVAGKAVFNVVDYKSSKPWSPRKRDAVDGTALQLELYTLAAEEVLLASTKALAWQGGYWFVVEGGFKKWVEVRQVTKGQLEPTPWWTNHQQKTIDKVLELVRGIRSAAFPVFSLDPDCTSRCPFNTVCRVNQVRSVEKIWPPPNEP
jgi:hypothetical protein